MKSRKILSFLAAVLFIFSSAPTMADDIEWFDLYGFIPGVGAGITFDTALGSLAIDPAGEIVTPLNVPDDYVLKRVHICFPVGGIGNPILPLPDSVALTIYQDEGPLIPPVSVATVEVFDPPLEPIIPSVECIAFDVYPDHSINPAAGQLYLGLLIGGAGPEYIKAVGIEELSDGFEIQDCDTGVADIWIDDPEWDNWLSELVEECALIEHKNHGQYVKCVSHLLNDLKKAGWITGRQKGKIQRCAAKSDYGKK